MKEKEKRQMKKGKMREEDENESRGRRERQGLSRRIVYPKEEVELYNSTMETQWHPFYLSIPVLDFPSPRLLCSPLPSPLPSQVHLRTWKLCINITIVPFVAGWCSVIYRCGLMNFLLPPRFIG